jgi:hypothetical protein
MVVDWGKKGLEGKTAALINLMRRRATATTTGNPQNIMIGARR